MGNGFLASKIAGVLAEAVGLKPSECLSADLHLDPKELAVLTFRVAVTDDSGQVLTEDGEIVTAIREFREVDE